MLNVPLRLFGLMLACAAAPALAAAPAQCSLPGLTVITDPASDQSPPGSAQQDISSVSIAELGGDVNKLTFTLKVASLSGTLQANGIWTVYFNVGSQEYLVDMQTDAQSVPSFHYGTSTGTQDTYVGAADSGSYAADGTITIKIANSKVGNPTAGSKLTAIYAETDVRGGGPAGPGLLVTSDDAPDSAPPGTAQYTLVGNASCGTPPPPPPQTPCTLPGITVLTDAAGDQTPPGNGQQDIQSVSIAELGGDTNMLSFTLKVASLSGTPQANGLWTVYFTVGTQIYLVDMRTDAQSVPVFGYGTSTGTQDTYVGTADSGSYAADGTITIKVATSKVGKPAAGSKLTAINASTAIRAGGPVGPGASTNTDTAPDTTPGTAQYTLVGNSFCGSPPPQTPCALPGLTVATDSTGDQASPGTASSDLQSVSVAELGADSNKLTITIKVASLSSVPPTADWRAYFKVGSTIYWVGMASDASSAVTYNYGTSTGSSDTTTGAADSGSFSPDGSIHVKISPSKIGNPAIGGNLTAFYADAYVQGGGTGATLLVGVDSAPDTTPGTGSYTLVGNAYCQNNPPTAVLTANPAGGTAPLPVTFDGSGSTDSNTGASITSYTFDFGDGSAPVTQAAPTVSYTYNAGGNWHAHLTVADSKGLVSAAAEAIVTVTGPPLANAGPDQTVDDGAAVQLDGSKSSDGNSGALSYAWSQVGGTPVTLTGANTVTAGFTAPAVCTPTDLTFNLTVANSAGSSAAQTVVTVQHADVAPVAEAGLDFTVGRGRPASLDGTHSTHDACGTLAYHWTQLTGTPVTLSDANSATPGFTAPNVDSDMSLTFRLDVTDSAGQGASDSVRVLVDSSVPADIGQTKVGALAPLGLLVFGLAALRRLSAAARRRRPRVFPSRTGSRGR